MICSAETQAYDKPHKSSMLTSNTLRKLKYPGKSNMLGRLMYLGKSSSSGEIKYLDKSNIFRGERHV